MGYRAIRKPYKKKPKQQEIEKLLSIYAAIGKAAKEQAAAQQKPPPNKT